MSWRTALMDVEAAFKYLKGRVNNDLAGDYGGEVQEALEVLASQIVAADRSVQLAETRNRLEYAERIRVEAQERLEELAP